MKFLIKVVLPILILTGCQGTSANTEIKTSINQLDKKLISVMSNTIDSLYLVDQNIQIEITNAFQNNKTDKVEDLLKEEEDIFKRHIPILKNIYNKIGYPTIDLVGIENSKHFFVLVQHSDADVEFQQNMLTIIENELGFGKVDAKDFAFLTDRVQLATDKPQIYGTQIMYNTNIGQAYPKKMIDSLNVNTRRLKIGLETIEDYLNKASKIHFLMNQKHYDEIGVSEPKLYD